MGDDRLTYFLSKADAELRGLKHGDVHLGAVVHVDIGGPVGCGDVDHPSDPRFPQADDVRPGQLVEGWNGPHPVARWRLTYRDAVKLSRGENPLHEDADLFLAVEEVERG